MLYTYTSNKYTIVFTTSTFKIETNYECLLESYDALHRVFSKFHLASTSIRTLLVESTNQKDSERLDYFQME